VLSYCSSLLIYFADEIEEVRYENKIKKAFSENLEEEVKRGKVKIAEITSTLENSKLEKENAEAEVVKISQRFSDIKEEIHHWQIMERMEEEIQQVIVFAFSNLPLNTSICQIQAIELV